MKGYQLKLSIVGSKPIVWRTLWIPKDMSFYQLHLCVQEVFGCLKEHEYEFRIPTYGISIKSIRWKEKNDKGFVIIDQEHSLFEYLEVGSIFSYEYDHQCTFSIVVQKEIEREETHPVLLKWKEDCDTIFEHQNISLHQQDIQKALNDIQILSLPDKLNADISNQLDQVICDTQKLLEKKKIENLSLVVLHREGQNVYIGFNQTQDTIVLQIYENETAYLQGVDYVSSNSPANIFANGYCIVMSHQPFSNASWTTKDHLCVAKIIKTGCFPYDLNDEQASYVIEVLKDFIQAMKKWRKKRLPNYDTNECLMAWINQEGCSIEKQMIHLTPQRMVHRLETEKVQTLEKESAHNRSIIRIDLLSKTVENLMLFDIFLIIEDSQQDFKELLPRDCLQTIDSLSEKVLTILYEYFYEHGIPDKIIVNNENVRFMLSGLCEDLSIKLSSEPFITKEEHAYLDQAVSSDLDVLESLASMDSDEFASFMETLDADDLESFQEFIKKFVDLDELNELFQEAITMQLEEEEKEKYPEPYKKKFDA